MISKKLERYLEERGADVFEVIPHPEAFTAQRTAEAEHAPGRMQAKVVMVKVDGQPTMAVLPANHRLDLERMREALDARKVHLMAEPEFEALFPDCEAGAMPPFGEMYNLPMYVDQRLSENDWILFNAGTHRESIRMTFRDYERLVRPALLPLAG